MLSIKHELTVKNFKNKEIEEWLNKEFFIQALEDHDRNVKGFNYFDHLMAEMDEWGKKFLQYMPDTLDESFFYITGTNGYSYVNLSGLAFQKIIWPEFFKLFPEGRILLLKLSEEWLFSTWDTQDRLKKDDLKGFYFTDVVPHETAGFNVTAFPWIAMRFLSYGIYPLILGNFSVPPESLVVIYYIPDKALSHSQVLNSSSPYRNILLHLFDYFNDQWTFDSDRGPKWKFDPRFFNPLESLDYIQWYFTKINDRMNELKEIKDEVNQFKVGSTINRALIDAVCSITSEVPYMSKIFFFNCLEKLSNLMKQLKPEQIEVDVWKKLISQEFLTVLKIELSDILGNIGYYLSELIDLVIEEMKIGQISPNLLRALRNSHHGYKLRPNTFKELMDHNGEINNSIPLLIAPLILYFLTQKWS